MEAGAHLPGGLRRLGRAANTCSSPAGHWASLRTRWLYLLRIWYSTFDTNPVNCEITPAPIHVLGCCSGL